MEVWRLRGKPCVTGWKMSVVLLKLRWRPVDNRSGIRYVSFFRAWSRGLFYFSRNANVQVLLELEIYEWGNVFFFYENIISHKMLGILLKLIWDCLEIASPTRNGENHSSFLGGFCYIHVFCFTDFAGSWNGRANYCIRTTWGTTPQSNLEDGFDRMPRKEGRKEGRLRLFSGDFLLYLIGIIFNIIIV
jgi:hypothetical protein